MPRLDARRPYWAWTAASGFDFFETEAERDSYRTRQTDAACCVGKIPVEVISPPRTDLLQLGDPVLTIPGPLYAMLWQFAAEGEHRWQLNNRVWFDGDVAWASNGYMLGRVDLTKFGPSDIGRAHWGRDERRALVPMAARDIELLRNRKTYLEVFANGVVRAMKRKIRAPHRVLGYCGELATLGEAANIDPWKGIHEVFAKYSADMSPGLHVPLQAALLGRILTAAGSTPTNVASNPRGAVFATANGLSALLLSMSYDFDVAEFWAKHGVKIQPASADEGAEGETETTEEPATVPVGEGT